LLFYDGKMFSYESKRERPLPTPHAVYITDLGAILKANGLWDIIGIQAYADGTIGMNTTDHKAKFSMTVDYLEGAPELKEKGGHDMLCIPLVQVSTRRLW
jgi:hypothetical protein